MRYNAIVTESLSSGVALSPGLTLPVSAVREQVAQSTIPTSPKREQRGLKYLKTRVGPPGQHGHLRLMLTGWAYSGGALL